QAGRSALAHYVHWTAPMGARVLIKGNWYYRHPAPPLHLPSDQSLRVPSSLSTDFRYLGNSWLRHSFSAVKRLSKYQQNGRPGRKPIPTRRVVEAVLWLLNTGA